MSGSIFLDTNVLVYLYSNDDLVKKAQATVAVTQGQPWISTQVLIEFVNVSRRKLKESWSSTEAGVVEFQATFSFYPNPPATILRAIQLAQRYGFSWFDALIVAAALDCGCQTLYSEDLQHG